jgi:hypothetical protein
MPIQAYFKPTVWGILGLDSRHGFFWELSRRGWSRTSHCSGGEHTKGSCHLVVSEPSINISPSQCVRDVELTYDLSDPWWVTKVNRLLNSLSHHGVYAQRQWSSPQLTYQPMTTENYTPVPYQQEQSDMDLDTLADQVADRLYPVMHQPQYQPQYQSRYDRQPQTVHQTVSIPPNFGLQMEQLAERLKPVFERIMTKLFPEVNESAPAASAPAPAPVPAPAPAPAPAQKAAGPKVDDELAVILRDLAAMSARVQALQLASAAEGVPATSLAS